jgi:hypothetical protein
MPSGKFHKSNLRLRLLVNLMIAGGLILGATPGLTQTREKAETIEASSMGTGTQL